jgi:ATP-dependent Zn protease
MTATIQERTRTNREMSAVHEAAHAVIGRRLGLELVTVDIVRADGFCGRVRCAVGDRPAVLTNALRLEMMAYAVMAAAGPESELRVLADLGVEIPAEVHELLDATSDAGTVRMVGAILVPERADEFVAWARRYAQELLVEEWPTVHHVARALLERERLTGAEVDQLLHNHPQQHQGEEPHHVPV